MRFAKQHHVCHRRGGIDVSVSSLHRLLGVSIGRTRFAKLLPHWIIDQGFGWMNLEN